MGYSTQRVGQQLQPGEKIEGRGVKGRRGLEEGEGWKRVDSEGGRRGAQWGSW